MQMTSRIVLAIAFIFVSGVYYGVYLIKKQNGSQLDSGYRIVFSVALTVIMIPLLILSF